MAERDKYGANDCVPGLTSYPSTRARRRHSGKGPPGWLLRPAFGLLAGCEDLFRTIVLHHDGVVEGRQKE